jgi:hypothetical protein
MRVSRPTRAFFQNGLIPEVGLEDLHLFEGQGQDPSLLMRRRVPSSTFRSMRRVWGRFHGVTLGI